MNFVTHGPPKENLNFASELNANECTNMKIASPSVAEPRKINLPLACCLSCQFCSDPTLLRKVLLNIVALPP